MKIFFLFSTLISILFSCINEKKFYDVEDPKVNFTNPVNDEEVLVQFDEPVKHSKLFI